MQKQDQVKVSIVAELSGQFKQAFTAADKQMAALGKTAQDLNKKVGDIGAFRKQQNAVKDAGRAWTESKTKLAALKKEIGSTEQASNKQLAALKRAEAQTRRTAGAYSEQRMKLAQMNSELQKSGVNVAKLSNEYKRLQTEIVKTTAKQNAAEKSLLRQQKIVAGMEKTWRGMGAAAKGVAAAGAGLLAGGAVLSRPAAQGMNWQERIMRLADVAGTGKSVDQKKQIEKQLSDAITASQKFGGGKRDDIAGGLDTLIGTGGMAPGEASAMLPMIARAAFASGTDASQVAAIALKAKQFGATDTASALDIVMRGGQAGGVEMKHMAQFLPEQMSSARAAGYSGNEGLSQLVAMNQLALRTAGTPEQAANNVQNLLNKLIAPEFSKNVKDVTGKDWEKYSVEQRSKGVYGAEAFAQLADESMGKDQNYQKLKAQLAQTKDEGQRAALLGDMSSMMEGSQMGQFIQDRQALSAGLAMMYARKDIDPATGKSAADTMVETAARGPGGVAGSSEYLRTGTFSQATDAAEAVNRANEATFNQVSGPLNGLLQSVTGLTEEFPKVTTAAYSAAIALGAVAATGIVGGMVSGRRGPKPPKGIAAPVVGGAAGKLRGGAKMGVAGAALGGAFDVYSAANDDTLTPGEKKQAYTSAAGGAIGGWAGAEAGAAAGAALGAFGGPLAPITVPAGALIGGAVGGYAGYQGGAALGDMAGEKMFNDAAKSAAESATAASQAATAAQNKPNVTNTYNLSVTAPPGAGALELGNILTKAIQDSTRKADADARSSMSDKVGL